MTQLKETPAPFDRHHESTSSPGDHLLEVSSLHVHYGRVCALRDVGFSVSCGHSVALVGGNGAGKTTLMKAIVRLVPAEGSVIWRGEAVNRNTHEVAYLPQRTELDWSFPVTVRALVETGRYPLLGLWRKMRKDDYLAIDNALETMQITDLCDRQIGALSGGQQQRVFIARALVQEAHVLLLDEPFAGLDQPSCEILSQLLGVLTRKGCLVIAAHHNISTVESLFDSVLLLNRQVIAFGSPADVLNEANLKAVFGI